MHVFFTVLTAGKSRTQGLANLVSDESFVPGLQMATFSLYLHMAEGRDGGRWRGVRIPMSPVTSTWLLSGGIQHRV